MKRLIAIVILLATNAACGVPKTIVREQTTTISHVAEGGRDSLRRCKEGEADRCDEADRRLAQIKDLSDQLNSKAK